MGYGHGCCRHRHPIGRFLARASLGSIGGEVARGRDWGCNCRREWCGSDRRSSPDAEFGDFLAAVHAPPERPGSRGLHEIAFFVGDIDLFSHSVPLLPLKRLAALLTSGVSLDDDMYGS